uniref:Uncharacterized protein n=1 Tax=Rhizophora mucronata TaxID=61149 RepID=A0A2P2NH81_RHIMU
MKVETDPLLLFGGIALPSYDAVCISISPISLSLWDNLNYEGNQSLYN